jgi:hypothetical protein
MKINEPLIEWLQLGIVLKAHINTVFTFRQFSGIAAMVERLFGSEFATASENQASLKFLFYFCTI